MPILLLDRESGLKLSTLFLNKIKFLVHLFFKGKTRYCIDNVSRSVLQCPIKIFFDTIQNFVLITFFSFQLKFCLVKIIFDEDFLNEIFSPLKFPKL